MAVNSRLYVSAREVGVDIYQTPLPARVCTILVGLTTACILSSLITQRWVAVKDWRKMPWVMWTVFLLYGSSLAYCYYSILIPFAIGDGTNQNTCNATGIICIVLYVASKTFVYLFLVDRAHIIRGTTKRRLKSKLYLWNTFGMLSIYTVIGVFDLIYRIHDLREGDKCVIGIKWDLMIPLITYDALANIYLTILFLKPLLSSYSVRRHLWKPPKSGLDGYEQPLSPPNVKLRRLALRTIVGSIATLLSSLINMTVLAAVHGEVAWLCIICCTTDILFSALVIHWVIHTDRGPAGTTQDSNAWSSSGSKISSEPLSL